nr:MAG TPA: hypothetical protein [Caudoviricetes sp.]
MSAKTHTAMMLCSIFPLSVPAQGDFLSLYCTGKYL